MGSGFPISGGFIADGPEGWTGLGGAIPELGGSGLPFSGEIVADVPEVCPEVEGGSGLGRDAGGGKEG